ncbi:MAG: hypothetical protein ACQ9MH_25335 [Nitrospinales bacterium]
MPLVGGSSRSFFCKKTNQSLIDYSHHLGFNVISIYLDKEVVTRLPSGFLMKIISSPSGIEKSPCVMSIIIRQPYTHLLKEMFKTFGGKEDVQIMVDRRRDQRRRKKQLVKLERRQADRRRPKEELVEVTLSV